MSELTKEEVATQIRNLVPYLERPMILAPKGCFKEDLSVGAGKIIEYDPSLMPQCPQVISVAESLSILVDLYKSL